MKLVIEGENIMGKSKLRPQYSQMRLYQAKKKTVKICTENNEERGGNLPKIKKLNNIFLGFRMNVYESTTYMSDHF